MLAELIYKLDLAARLDVESLNPLSDFTVPIRHGGSSKCSALIHCARGQSGEKAASRGTPYSKVCNLHFAILSLQSSVLYPTRSRLEACGPRATRISTPPWDRAQRLGG